MKNKYEQLNVISFISMLWVYNIHFMLKFSSTVTSEVGIILVALSNAISFIAVPLFLAISAYTHFYLGRKVDVKNYFYILLFLHLF